MKNHLLPGAALTLCCLFQTFSKTHAQSPGQIVRPVGGAGITTLNPNGDGYASATTAGFTTDDIAQSEVPYKVVPPAVTEPTGDLATGPSGGFTDIVKTIDNSGFYIHTNGTNLYFRLRIGGIISGSKGYSVLIDTDNRMGNTGSAPDPGYVAATNSSNGNPGFEYEVVLRTNFDVTVYNVDGVGNPVALTPVYTLNSNSQISMALSTDGNNADYFYDWVVPLAAIGNPASIRLAATTVTSPTSALQGSRSDVYGIDDRLYKNALDAWTAVINAQPSISITNFSSYGTTIGSPCTAAPAVNSPILIGSNVVVSGTWTRMDASKPGTATITLYKTSGTTTTTYTTSVTSGSTWSVNAGTVVNGDVFYARAQATGESQCLQSDNVTAGCSSYPAQPTITSSSTKCLSGSIASGATANIYLLNSNTGTPGLVTSVAAVGTTFTYGNCQGAANQIASGTYMVIATLNGCNSTPVFDCNSGGNQTANPLTTNSGITISGPVYPFHTSISGNVPSSTSVQLLRLFINDAYFSAITVAASTTVYSISGLSLKSGDQLKLYLQSGTSCATAAASTTTVSCYNAPPVITTDANSNLLTTATSISGTATPNASITLNRTAPTMASWTTTANSSGVWTVPGLWLAAGEIYTARVTATSGCSAASTASSAATVATATTCPSMSFAASYSDASTSVTVNMASFTGTLRLYLDGYLIGTSNALTLATTCTFPISANTLYNTGVLTVTAKGSAATAGETGSCVSQTISCSSPLTPVITPTSSTINTGQTVSYSISNVSSGSWYAISDDATGQSYATSLYKTDNTSFTLSTNQFATAGTYNVKISADKLTGCSASLSTASITVNNTVLPVHFLKVTASKETDHTKVTWLVEAEQNVNRYEVERSYDCARFQKIATVPYAPVTGTNTYRYRDDVQTSGTVCYRIKQVDNDERFMYSYVVMVKMEETNSINLLPNPARTAATVAIRSSTEGPAMLELLNLKGAQLFQKAIHLRPQTYRFKLNLAGLAAGIYVVKVSTPQQVYYQKLLVE